MSDLQCAATFLVLGSAGAEAGSRVAGTRLAAAYAAPEGHAVAAAAVQRSGLTVATLEPDGTSYAAALEGLADLHRGETVLVVLPEAAAAALADAWGRQADGPDTVLEVAVDGDGWSVRIWTSASSASQGG
jgi:hypothetical protein